MSSYPLSSPPKEPQPYKREMSKRAPAGSRARSEDGLEDKGEGHVAGRGERLLGERGGGRGGRRGRGDSGGGVGGGGDGGDVDGGAAMGSGGLVVELGDSVDGVVLRIMDELLRSEAARLKSRLRIMDELLRSEAARLMRQALEARFVAAEEIRKVVEQEKLDKEESVEDIFLNNKIDGEGGSRLREFLMDRGLIVDMFRITITMDPLMVDIELNQEKIEEAKEEEPLLCRHLFDHCDYRWPNGHACNIVVLCVEGVSFFGIQAIEVKVLFFARARDLGARRNLCFKCLVVLSPKVFAAECWTSSQFRAD
ncbi:hypothetical protein Syun_023089 [Stephania yunnanensis]|uniref:Uncharacterized protein n=1 Tax=Stephania yunnanensis TaxID=152371 RepID=A0AAP0FLH3_9MAGN